MNKATLVVGPFYQNNKIFDLNDKIVNRDNCMYPFFLLKSEFEKAEINLATQDINPISESQNVIYNEMPKNLPQGKEIEKSYLLIFESELIRPDNWDLKKHRYFKKIFTWNDNYVDNKKYFKMNFSQKIPESLNMQTKDKLCTLIAGNKMNQDKRELYSERLKAIKWFEKNHPGDFDLYGMGWDKLFLKIPFNYFNRLDMCKSIAVKFRPSFKGVVQSKNDVYSRYKFAICFENVKDIPGYITEKIFDCFFAGCVPVYWGASNIQEFVPKECFIDKRNFSSYEDLYGFIYNIDENIYFNYINAIESYLQGKEIKLFSAEYFSKTIFNNIIGSKSA